MNRVLRIAKTGVAGLGLGLLYKTVQSSFSSIHLSSLNSAETRAFNSKFPYIRYHSDLNFVVQELIQFAPFADVESVAKLCNSLMKRYVYFNETDKSAMKPETLIGFPKKVHDICHDIKEAAEDLQTDLIAARPREADEVINHVQMLQKIADDILFNVMMDVDVSM